MYFKEQKLRMSYHVEHLQCSFKMKADQVTAAITFIRAVAAFQSDDVHCFEKYHLGRGGI